MKKLFFLPFLTIALLFTACTKDEPNDEPTPQPQKEETTNLLYVLNQGNWGSNDASLSAIDPKTGKSLDEIFESENGRPLGDVAQDMLLYGDKLYIITFSSNTLEVFDTKNHHSMQVLLSNHGLSSPRSLAIHQGKLYISCYAPQCVARFDATTLAFESRCPISGYAPEAIAVLGNKLFVANGYQMDENNNYLYDSTLTIVNLSTFTEEGKITIGLNPTSNICTIDDHTLAISYAGNYADAQCGITVVDVVSGNQWSIPYASNYLSYKDNTIYFSSTGYDANWNPTTQFYATNTNTRQSTELNVPTTLPNAYAILPNADGFYILNSPYQSNGDVYCYDANFHLKWNTEVGAFPVRAILK